MQFMRNIKKATPEVRLAFELQGFAATYDSITRRSILVQQVFLTWRNMRKQREHIFLIWWWKFSLLNYDVKRYFIDNCALNITLMRSIKTNGPRSIRFSGGHRCAVSIRIQMILFTGTERTRVRYDWLVFHIALWKILKFLNWFCQCKESS